MKRFFALCGGKLFKKQSNIPKGGTKFCKSAYVRWTAKNVTKKTTEGMARGTAPKDRESEKTAGFWGCEGCARIS